MGTLNTTHTHTYTHTHTQNKCSPYWPDAEEEPVKFGKYLVENLGCEEEHTYRLTHLKLDNLEVIPTSPEYTCTGSSNQEVCLMFPHMYR